MRGKSQVYTHPGHIRKNNEDSFYANDRRGLWIVCDGMGGHQEGNFASHLVTDIFEQMQMRGSFENKIEAITAQLYNIHLILQKKAQKTGKNAVIGTTLVLLFVEGKRGVSIHSGDSRCYILRDDQLSMVTVDHAQDIETPHGIRKVLTKALSAPGEFSFEMKKFQVKEEDTYLLCSDGLYDNLSNAMIKKGMIKGASHEGLDLLTSMVLSQEANDNLTAVMVEI